MLKKGKVIDLSWTLRPGKEQRLLEVEVIDGAAVTGANEEERGQGWYIMSNVKFVSHQGTHIESPYHALPEGKDISQIEPERLIGEALVLDLTYLKPGEGATPEMLQEAAEKAGGIRKGDMVFIATGHDRFYREDHKKYWNPFPYLTKAATEWLVGQDISVYGVDWTGSMDPKFNDRDNHLVLFSKDIPVIENLRNLTLIAGKRVFVSALPISIEKLESCPLRVVAIVDGN
jgi:arylformamidase